MGSGLWAEITALPLITLCLGFFINDMKVITVPNSQDGDNQMPQDLIIHPVRQQGLLLSFPQEDPKAWSWGAACPGHRTVL